jgi:hypothetical protein
MYPCTVCGRTDLKLTQHSKIRKHTSNGKRASEDNPHCAGSGTVPAGNGAAAPQSAFHAAPVPGDPAAVAGPERGDVATAGDGSWTSPVVQAGSVPDQCPGCGHAGHSGICRELTMDGPPGDVDECGCLDDQEPVAAGAVVRVADCRQCDQDLHVCPGCGEPVKHGVTVCADCNAPDVHVAAPQSAAGSFLMGTAHDASDGYGDAMDALMAGDRPSDGTDQLYKNGRYALPDPVTGVPRTWTRSTTMAETLSDLYSLNLWKVRMAMIGVTRFPDLLDELREIDAQDSDEGNLSPKVHREILNRVGLRAQDLAGAKVPASWGTDMHNNIEALSRDEITLDDVPEKYRREVTAWAAAMSDADLSAVPHLIERVISVPLYGVAGRFDQIDRIHRSRSIRLGNRIVRLNAGDHIPGDVKSGRDLDYGWGEISIQMSLYAHGAREGKVAKWDPEGGDGEGAWVWEDIGIPAKSIRTDVGVVMHVPIGGGQCTLHWIDLEEGWKAVQLCEAVKDWRRAKGLHTPFSIAEVPTGEAARPVVRQPDWDEKFSGVTTTDQAREVYRAYLAAGGSKGLELARLVDLAKTHLRQLTEESA